MKKILIGFASICLLCSSFAYGENSLLTIEFWETATVEDVNSAVANGADVDAGTESGITALMFAGANNTNPDVVERLVKLGADLDARTESGITALMATAANNTNPEVVERLVKLGADVDARDESGETALMFAARLNTNPDVVERLLKLGADVDARDESGKTALSMAKLNESLKGTKAYWMLNDATYNKK